MSISFICFDIMISSRLRSYFGEFVKLLAFIDIVSAGGVIIMSTALIGCVINADIFWFLWLSGLTRTSLTAIHTEQKDALHWVMIPPSGFLLLLFDGFKNCRFAHATSWCFRNDDRFPNRQSLRDGANRLGRNLLLKCEINLNCK